MKTKSVFLNECCDYLCETNGILPLEKGLTVEIVEEEGGSKIRRRVEDLCLVVTTRVNARKGIHTIKKIELRVILGRQ